MHRYDYKCRRQYRSSIRDFKVTKREALFSIIIFLTMVCLGLFVENSISNKIAESNEIYYKATKIDNNSDQFKYGMETNIGNTLVHGEFNAVDEVRIPELVDGYFAIDKVTERYTRHTRTVTTTDSKGKTSTRTETYYNWDDYNTDRHMSNKFSFLDCEFGIDKIDLDNYERLTLNDKNVSSSHITWVKGNYLYNNGDKWANVGDLRYKYNIIPKSFMGSMMARLKEDSIHNIDKDGAPINIMPNRTIGQVVESKQKSEAVATTMFWIIWMILTIGIIIGFIYLENKWLEETTQDL